MPSSFPISGARWLRCSSVLLVLLAISLQFPRAAEAKSKKNSEELNACIEHFEKGQDDLSSVLLRSADENFVACSRAECPAEIQSECRANLSEVRRRMPTISLRARDENDEDVQAVRVYVDNVLLTDGIGGRALSIDPGSHQLRWEVDGYRSDAMAIVVREGEKERFVDVRLRRDEDGEDPSFSAPAADSGWGNRENAYLFGGIEAASFIGFAILGFNVDSRERDMESSCAPNCPEGEVNDLNRDAWIANGLLITSIVSFGFATYFWFKADDEAAKRAASGLSFDGDGFRAKFDIAAVPYGGAVMFRLDY